MFRSCFQSRKHKKQSLAEIESHERTTCVFFSVRLSCIISDDDVTSAHFLDTVSTVLHILDDQKWDDRDKKNRFVNVDSPLSFYFVE